MPTRPLRPLLLLTAVLASHCAPNTRLTGDGHLVESTRQVGPFTGISASEALRVEVTPGQQAVRLRVDGNLAPHLRTDLAGGTLELGAEPDVDLTLSPGAVIQVSAPLVDSLATSGLAVLTGQANGTHLALASSGGSELTVETTAARSVSLDASGESRLRVTGAGEQLALTASGNARVDSGLPASSAEVEASGNSRVTVRASARLRVRASGRSVVVVHGNPADRSLDTSGEASITFLP